MSIVDIEDKLDAAIMLLDRRISLLVAKLDTEDGLLVSEQANLDRARLMRDEITAEFNVYMDAAREATDTYTEAGRDVRGRFQAVGFDLSFTEQDAQIITDWSNDTFQSMASLGAKTSGDIGNIVYSSVISGGDIVEMTDQISQLLVGQKDKRGLPLSNHAKTLATTKYMEVDAIMTKRKADELGVKRFRYSGSLIGDSRPWCVDHVGKVFTVDEIREWEGKSWAGKAPGDPFVVRGGWNCRHNFTPVADE